MALHTLDELKHELEKRPKEVVGDVVSHLYLIEDRTAKWISEIPGFTYIDGLTMVLNGWDKEASRIAKLYDEKISPIGEIQYKLNRCLTTQNPDDDGGCSDLLFSWALKNVDELVDKWIDKNIEIDEKRIKRVKWLETNMGKEAADAYKNRYTN